MTISFSLRQLEYAAAVAEHGGFRRAAEACHVAQPSLSAQLAQLEDSLGVVLFERNRRGVVVTPAGELLLPRIRRVLMESEDLSAAARHSTDPLEGDLRIGVIPTIAPYLLPVVVPRVRAKFPMLTILWSEGKTADISRELRDGSLDAALLALEADIGDVDHAVIARDPFVLATSPQHRLAKSKRAVDVKALAAETVLLLDDGHCFRDQALDLCTRVGARERDYRATSLSTLVQVATSLDGVTLLPELAVAVENRTDELAIRRFKKPAPYRTLVLAFRRSSPLSESFRALAGALSP